MKRRIGANTSRTYWAFHDMIYFICGKRKQITMIAIVMLSVLAYTYTYAFDISPSMVSDIDDPRSILMIVAHPDDETLWGGDFLVQNGARTHVVVATGDSGKHTQRRTKEFKAVGLMLGFKAEILPGVDKFEHINLKKSVRERIRHLICSSDFEWNQIITHGPEGEYGHPLHHVVYGFVIDSFRYCCLDSNKLFVFNPRPPSPTIRTPSLDGWSKKKVEALHLYESQKRVVFKSFLGWNESIVQVENYDYAKASKVCKEKNIHKSNGENYCRLHKYLSETDSKAKLKIANKFRLLFSSPEGAKIPTSLLGKGDSCKQ